MAFVFQKEEGGPTDEEEIFIPRPDIHPLFSDNTTTAYNVPLYLNKSYKL